MNLTPFGMLVSGQQQARSWRDFDAGQARSSLPVVGFGWAFPTTARPAAESSLFLTIDAGEFSYRTRPEFDLIGLRAIEHGPLLLTYRCETSAFCLEASYLLMDDENTLVEVIVLKSLSPRQNELRLGLGSLIAHYQHERRSPADYPLGSPVLLQAPASDPWDSEEQAKLHSAITRTLPELEYEQLLVSGSSCRLRLAPGERVQTVLSYRGGPSH